MPRNVDLLVPLLLWFTSTGSHVRMRLGFGADSTAHGSASRGESLACTTTVVFHFRLALVRVPIFGYLDAASIGRGVCIRRPLAVGALSRLGYHQ